MRRDRRRLLRRGPPEGVNKAARRADVRNIGQAGAASDAPLPCLVAALYQAPRGDGTARHSGGWVDKSAAYIGRRFLTRRCCPLVPPRSRPPRSAGRATSQNPRGFSRGSMMSAAAMSAERDKVSLDIMWLRDESLEDAEDLPPPEVIAQEIVEDLEAALAEFAAIATTIAAS